MQAAMSAKTRTKTKSIVTGCDSESPKCTNSVLWLLSYNFLLTVLVNPSVWTQCMNFVLKSQEQSVSSLRDLGKFPCSTHLVRTGFIFGFKSAVFSGRWMSQQYIIHTYKDWKNKNLENNLALKDKNHTKYLIV